jgi:plasmid stabilization system protein ParE
MERTVRYSSDALGQIREIWQYVDENLSAKAADQILVRIEEKVEWISKYAETGHLSEVSPKIRYVLVDKHRRLYYEIDEDEVIILALFDTRQDIQKRPF